MSRTPSLRRTTVQAMACAAIVVSVLVSARAAVAQTSTMLKTDNAVANARLTPRVDIAVSPPVVLPPSGMAWTGLYVGGIVGLGNGTADVATTVQQGAFPLYFATSSVTSINTNGAATITPKKSPFGGEVGFNAQAGGAFFGAEGDFSSLKFSDSHSVTVIYPCCAPTQYTLKQSIATNWLITVRGRGGVNLGRALVYGTAGLAWIDLDYEALFTETFANGTETGSINKKQSALVWGGGAEFRGGKHWSVKGEFLTADFSHGTPFTTTSTNLATTTGGAATWPNDKFTHSTTFKMNVIRGGINFGF